MSLTDIDKVGEGSELSCFQSATRRILKRKHSESNIEENEPKPPKKSFFATLGEKLGLSRTSVPPKSILTTNSSNRFTQGEMNYSYQHDGYSSFVTNGELEREHEIPRKRVKFDEENLIVSSITYQRQQTEAYHMMTQPGSQNNQSFFTKFVNYTASLF